MFFVPACRSTLSRSPADFAKQRAGLAAREGALRYSEELGSVGGLRGLDCQLRDVALEPDVPEVAGVGRKPAQADVPPVAVAKVKLAQAADDVPKLRRTPFRGADHLKQAGARADVHLAGVERSAAPVVRPA